MQEYLDLYKKNFYEIECFDQKKNVIQEYVDIVNSSSVRRKFSFITCIKNHG